MTHHYPMTRRHDSYDDSLRSSSSRTSWQDRQLALSTIEEVSSTMSETHETYSLRMETETRTHGGNSGHSSLRSQPDSGIGYIARGQTPPSDKAENVSGDRSTNGDSFIWDFAETKAEPRTPSCCAHLGERLIKVARVGTYIVIFVVVLVASLSSQLTLRFMAHGLNTQNANAKKKEHHVYLLALSLGIPDILSFLSALYRRIRGKPSTLAWRRCLVNLALEVFHAASLYSLTFLVAPAFRNAEMSTLTSVAASFPALAITVTVWREKSGAMARTLHLLAFLAQVTAAGAFAWKVIFDGTLSTEVRIWAVAALLAFSLRWVKSYVPSFGDSYANDNFSLLLSAAFRLVVGGVLLKGYLFQQLGDPIQAFHQTYSEMSKSVGSDKAFLSLFAPFLVHLTSTWVCYYMAVIACKLLMQRVGFLLPLCASTLAFFFLELFIPNVAAILFDGEQFSSDMPGIGERNIAMYVSFGVGFLSQVWICRQCWSETDSARLAFTKSLFVLPHYCALSPQLHLLHSRRRQQLTSQNDDVNKSSEHDLPTVHACATMWHESETEMTLLLKSLMRLDKFQCIERIRSESNKRKDVNSFHFEGHIFFDDAMTDRNGCRVPNEYVETFFSVVDNVASDIHKMPVTLKKDLDVATPYGRQIQWKMCGGNSLVVHLKDKSKIKIKKRWSQVMYMYYLLNFRLLSQKPESRKDEIPEWVTGQADNVFLLALDGDVKFEPEAVMLLVDRMRKNKDVGAACGRITPQGTGPVVWYQKFEYAVGHWLQKSAEHVFGCVLCSPGCFSLFRGSAVLAPNVLHTYTRNAKSAMDHLQCDQGEDRWLCTLMLKRGYRVEYCAVSKAVTFAPEEFKEFFNQRRRWGPSTMANIMDLIKSWSSTVRNNHSISHLYMFYTVVLFVSSVLGPATVLLAIQSSMASVFSLQSWLAYLLSYGPTVLFVIVCLRARAETQLNMAMALSAVFALVMMAVIVGTVVNIAQEGWYSPNGMFLYVLIGCTLLAGILHPHELSDLIWGGLYFLCVPAGYLFLTIYTICNLNVVSWGTRETKSINKQHEESQGGSGRNRRSGTMRYLEEATGLLTRRLKDDNRISQTCCGAFTLLFRQLNFTSSNTILVFILHALNRLDASRGGRSRTTSFMDDPDPDYDGEGKKPAEDTPSQADSADTTQTKDVGALSAEERQFWKDFIAKYLEPEQPKNEEKRQEEEDKKRALMLELRNKWAFVFFFCNGLWLVIISALQEVKAHLNVSWKPTEDGATILLEPLGLLYLAVFAILLLLQVSAMISHRYGALLHSIAFVQLRDSRQQRDKLFQKHFDDAMQAMQAELETAATASAMSTLRSLPNGTLNAVAADTQLSEEFEDFIINRPRENVRQEYQPYYEPHRPRQVPRRQVYDMYTTFRHRQDQFYKTRQAQRRRTRPAMNTQPQVQNFPV